MSSENSTGYVQPNATRPARRQIEVRTYDSFAEENTAEHTRRANMSHHERLAEFAELQTRAWGDAWISKPMKRAARWEEVSW